MRSIERDPYSLCPCGSGRKYRFCCRGRERRGERAGGLQEVDAPSGERILVMDLERGEREQEAGLECLQAGRTAAAIRHFERAIAAAPLIPAPHNNLALAYFVAGDLTRAVTVSERVTRDLQPANVFALASQVHYHLLLGQPDQAQACGERMQRLDPQDSIAREKRCEAFARLGRHAALLADARHARAADARQAAAFAFYAGVAAANLTRYDEAASRLARATAHAAHGDRARRYLELLRRKQGPGTLDGNWPYLGAGHWVSSEALERLLPEKRGAPPHPGLIHPLRALLDDDGDADERGAALELLARLGTDEAKAVLRRVAFGTFGDDELRVHAHSLLRRAGDPAVHGKTPMYLSGRWIEGGGAKSK